MLAVADVSGSMLTQAGSKTRLGLAQEATRAGFGYFQDTDAFGLWTFSLNLGGGGRDYVEQVPVARLDAAHRDKVTDAIDELDDRAVGGTGLYDTTLAAYQAAKEGFDPERRNYVVLFTDGQNEDTGQTLTQLTSALKKEADRKRPISVVLVGIGPDVDRDELGQIAKAAGGKALTADQPEDINRVMIDALVARID